VLPVLLGGLAVTADDAPATGVADVGVVTPSSDLVHLLGDDDADDHVTLARLHDETLRNFAWWGDGAGVDVALIDTGVSPVDGLDDGRVLHGPDLSGEGGIPQVAFLDSYGHGTHLAGIIAGDRAGAPGLAPAARIVSVKVAGRDGVTTVPQVVAAIDWVIEHGQRDGLNVRVLNLSLGLAGVDDHRGDLLSAAVERAWDAGIFVVVAAGNDGDDQPHLDSPAISPWVMAVGAIDTTEGERDDYEVPDWSATGDGVRNPEAAAAGRSIASYRVPGSAIDELAPGARVGDDLMRGSGTSQSAAVVSGLAARLIGAFPFIDNDDVKATLLAGTGLLDEPPSRAGVGYVDGELASSNLRYMSPDQHHDRAAGPGTGVVSPSGATWSGGTWSGATWSGATWSGATWSGATWSGATWSGATWSGATWSGATWSGATWSGSGWE
ncbi:MAG: S8 family serine peptidase, partial [Actinomycetota bacterium]